MGRIDDAANQGLTVLAELALGGSMDCSQDAFTGTLSTTWFSGFLVQCHLGELGPMKFAETLKGSGNPCTLLQI